MPARLESGYVRFGHLGFHAAHACNLTCDGCSHFSNHRLPGIVSLDEIREQIEPWRGRLSPVDMVIAGGEPTLNKQLPEIVRYISEAFPASQVEVISNGFLLPDRGEAMIEACLATNALVKISIHHMSKEYLQALTPIKAILKGWSERGVRIVYTASITRWTSRYQGFGAELKPFTDNDAEASFGICSHRYTQNELSFQIFRGRLWKCPPVAYLELVNKKYPLGSEWDDYMNHESLDPATASQEQVVEYLNRGAEACCLMCPAYKRPLQIANPLQR